MTNNNLDWYLETKLDKYLGQITQMHACCKNILPEITKIEYPYVRTVPGLSCKCGLHTQVKPDSIPVNDTIEELMLDIETLVEGITKFKSEGKFGEDNMTLLSYMIRNLPRGIRSLHQMKSCAYRPPHVDIPDAPEVNFPIALANIYMAVSCRDKPKVVPRQQAVTVT